MIRGIICAVAVTTAIAAQAPALQPAHPVRGNTLRVDWEALSTINVQRGFRYAGAQRFILRKVAEGDLANLGDTSTLADPAIVDELLADAGR